MFSIAYHLTNKTIIIILQLCDCTGALLYYMLGNEEQLFFDTKEPTDPDDTEFKMLHGLTIKRKKKRAKNN